MQTTAAIAIAFAVIAISGAFSVYKLRAPKRVAIKKRRSMLTAETYKKVLSLAQKELYNGDLNGKAIFKICEFLSLINVDKTPHELKEFLIDSIEVINSSF